MPFDAGMMAAVCRELNDRIIGARIDKIYQPERDEAVLSLRLSGENAKLLLSCSAGRARIGLTGLAAENPANPPMFCVVLRKHLSGGHIMAVEQPTFDRVLHITVNAQDEMGFPSKKTVVYEMMGTYSNVILLDHDRRVLAAMRAVELGTHATRQVLPGFPYEEPARQLGKRSLFPLQKEEFFSMLEESRSDGLQERSAEKYLVSHFEGFSPLIAREMVYQCAKRTDAALSEIDRERLWFHLNALARRIQAHDFVPTLLSRPDGTVLDFSFIPIRQYENAAVEKQLYTFGELFDLFYGRRDEAERMKVRAQDILKLLSNASARVSKKMENQKAELAECARREEFRRCGDLVTANIYRLKKGMTKALLPDYEREGMPEVEVQLDKALTPAQNAARYYKKYNKAKSAEAALTVQIEEDRKELIYLDSVFESLTKAENEKDLEEIRAELISIGYANKLNALRKSKSASKKDYRQRTKTVTKPMAFTTTGGFRVLCGKNNLQNDVITTVTGDKNDYWFHAKNVPGSHVLLRCGDREPSDADLTECAVIAAFYSKGRATPNLPVDYTRIRNVKKPAGAKPGFVIYSSNATAFVTADEDLVKARKAGAEQA